MMCVSQIIMLYTLYSAVCQLYLNKTWRKKDTQFLMLMNGRGHHNIVK